MTSHPPFVMPRDEESGNIAELTPAFFQHMESVQRHFLSKEGKSAADLFYPPNLPHVGLSGSVCDVQAYDANHLVNLVDISFFKFMFISAA